MSNRTAVFVAFAAILMAGSALAHHNMSAIFDFNDRVALTGTLTKMDWRNPHIYLTLDAKTGELVWRERLPGVGNHSSSPVAADGRIYFFNENGDGTVIAATREFKVLAENKLDTGFMASPAIAGKALYVRSKTHLYRIEN